MGYYCHHTIVVIGWNADKVREAHAFAGLTGAQVSAIGTSAINGWTSFFVHPDGSKEGWADSDAGDERREHIKAWLRQTTLMWSETAHPESGAPYVVAPQNQDDSEDEL